MNKSELVDEVSKDLKLTKTEINTAIDSIFNAITEALRKGHEVRLVGFGTFSVVHRKASDGRNPRTGEKIKIAATNAPKFKPGKTLKDKVSQGA